MVITVGIVMWQVYVPMEMIHFLVLPRRRKCKMSHAPPPVARLQSRFARIPQPTSPMMPPLPLWKPHSRLLTRPCLCLCLCLGPLQPLLILPCLPCLPCLCVTESAMCPSRWTPMRRAIQPDRVRCLCSLCRVFSVVFFSVSFHPRTVGKVAAHMPDTACCAWLWLQGGPSRSTQN